MGDIRLTPNNRYTFARDNNNTVILEGTDNAQTKTIFNHSIKVSSSFAGTGIIETNTNTNQNIFNIATPGNTTPILKLKTLNSAINNHLYVQFDHTSNDFSMGIVHGSVANTDDEGFFIFSDSSNIHNPSSRVMMFDKNTENVYIPNGGLVVGGANDGTQTAPLDGQLIVSSSNDVNAIRINIGPAASYYFHANSTSGYSTTFNMDDTELQIGHNSTSRKLSLRTGDTSRMTVAADANRVGINNGAPEKSLHIVNSGILLSGVGAIESGTGDGGLAPRFIIDTGASTSHQLCHMYSDTGVNILLVKGDGSIFMSHLNTQSSGGNSLKIFSGQVCEMTSTRKIKKNIEDLDSNFVDNFSKIRTVQFLHKSDDSPGYGFIAEEISKVHRNYATWGPDYARDEKGKKIRISKHKYRLDSKDQAPTGIDETTIIAAAVAKIQQLEKRINELENK